MDRQKLQLWYRLLSGSRCPILCALLMLSVMLRKCRVPGNRRRIWQPLLTICILIFYLLLYYLQVPWLRFLAGDMTAVLCLLYALTLELCIQCGLIQSNTRYAKLFEASTITAQITDRNFSVSYAAENAKPMEKSMLQAAKKEAIILPSGIRLCAAPIRNGYIFWQEDVSFLLSVLEELSGIQEELKGYHTLLDEENKQKKRRKRLDEQQRLYDTVKKRTAAHLALLDMLAQKMQTTSSVDEAKELLGKITIIGAYLKRRSNMIILSDCMGVIPSAELELCLKESISNLQLYDVVCAVRFEITGDMSAEVAGMLYDFFETAAELSLNTLTAMTAFIRSKDGGCCMELMLQCTEEIGQLTRLFPDASVIQEEDVWYCELTILEGGEEK